MCWTVAKCDRCHAVGHIAKYCRNELVKPENNKQNPVSVLGVFSKQGK